MNENKIERIASSLLRIAEDDSYIHDPEHEFHPSDLPAGKKWHRTERGWSSIEGEPQLSDYQKNQKSMRLSPKDIDKETLGRLLKIVRREGYDIPNKEHLYDFLFKGRQIGDWFRPPFVKNGVLWDTDYVDMVKEAIGGKQKRVENLQQKKQKQSLSPHVDRARLRDLGYTNDIREGGYLTSDGRMINLSSGHHSRGARDLDHREAGGSKGMREFMSEGNIRMDGNSASFDITAEPTDSQILMMSKIIRGNGGEAFIDLEHELGEEGNSYYYPSKDKESFQYPSGTSVNKILSDIRGYFQKHRINRISMLVVDD